jgi:hypothetical protein
MTEVTNPIALGNEPAFPTSPVTNANGEVNWGANGLTKREQLAAMAMQGILSNSVYEPPRQKKLAAMAADAVDAADALLAELAK